MRRRIVDFSLTIRQYSPIPAIVPMGTPSVSAAKYPAPPVSLFPREGPALASSSESVTKSMTRPFSESSRHFLERVAMGFRVEVAHG